MQGRKYEFVIVGSGAGGATLAKQLARKGKQVLVVERGKYEEKIGTIRGNRRYYDMDKLTRTSFAKSREGVILLRTFMAGGSTVVSCGNGVRCLEEELSHLGINLEKEFDEAEGEMQISPIPEAVLSVGSKRIMWASAELGYKMELMPKFIDSMTCRMCGDCAWGCIAGAKWTALDYLKEASQAGAEVLYNTRIEQVIFQNGKAKGLMGVGPNGRVEVMADIVILAAGGLGTPVILQKSGVKDAGSGLFVDLYVETYGVTKGLNQLNEPRMPLVDLEFHNSRGFILSPDVATVSSKSANFSNMGVRGLTLPGHRVIGIMTKITDEPVGQVYGNGKVSKPVTKRDRTRLQEGIAISKEILVKAGADSKSFVVTKVGGAHPGGTAAIGKVVDKYLQTKIDKLFVCDASVFPAAPGLPPILTIVAMAKRLAKTLAA
jgi:choline dehydrogenase-like flavoprotein